MLSVCSAQAVGMTIGSGSNSGCKNQGSCARSVKLSQSSVVAVATGGGKPGTVMTRAQLWPACGRKRSNANQGSGH